MLNFFAYCGLLASIWIVFGLFIAGRLYPNYSHMKQFGSELCAKYCPKEKI